MKHFLHAFIPILFLLHACAPQKNTANNTSPKAEELLANRQYTFVAQTVLPTEDSRFSPRLMFPNGNNLYQLTSRYDVRITTDSVIVYLPFFGRSFTAPVNPAEGGIKFTSTNFDYKQSMRKKNHLVIITPHDSRDVRTLYLTISPAGYATLQVQSINKTPIAFNGRIEENE